MDRLVEEIISPRELYRRTGIQKQPFNTIYQLMAVQREHPEYLAQAKDFLMIPDYFHYLLTGIKTSEYTNATTTGLIGAESGTWDRQLMKNCSTRKICFILL